MFNYFAATSSGFATAWIQGQRAHSDGLPRHACLFKSRPLRVAWQQGWGSREERLARTETIVPRDKRQH